jgi:ribonucleotide monophosphatase NagD (HAD superfamily)
MGAFRIGLDAVYQHLTGCSLPYTQIGKPFKTTYDFAERMLRRRLEEMGRPSEGALNVYMVGGQYRSTSPPNPPHASLASRSAMSAHYADV